MHNTIAISPRPIRFSLRYSDGSEPTVVGYPVSLPAAPPHAQLAIHRPIVVATRPHNSRPGWVITETTVGIALCEPMYTTKRRTCERVNDWLTSFEQRYPGEIGRRIIAARNEKRQQKEA